MRDFYKDFNYFEDFSRKIEAFSRIVRFFKYIFSGIEAFLKWCEAFPQCLCNLYKTYCHGGFLAQSALENSAICMQPAWPHFQPKVADVVDPGGPIAVVGVVLIQPVIPKHLILSSSIHPVRNLRMLS
jgi:hypothetical protein